MKFLSLALFIAVLGLSSSASISNLADRTLEDDFKDLYNLIAVKDVTNIVDQHLKTDGALAAVVQYLQGPEWATLVSTVLATPEVKEFIAYLKTTGLDPEGLIRNINTTISGWKPLAKADAKGSLKGLLDDIAKVVPATKLLGFFNDKLQNSKPFQDFFKEVSSPKSHALVEKVLKIPEAKRLVQRLRDLGVDIDGILKFVYDLLGWGTPPKPVFFNIVY